ALAVDEQTRQEKFEFAWNAGRGGVTLLGSFNDLSLDEEANQTAADFMRSKIRETVKDPATAEALCPTTYPLGTKRMALDTNYYESFNRDNVTLVDVRQAPIVSLTATGIKTTEAEYDVDVIILAIG
nr:cyclohexanone monooxygenase [Micromonospora sp. DSM 115978]